jgi:hypothetical protein
MVVKPAVKFILIFKYGRQTGSNLISSCMNDRDEILTAIPKSSESSSSKKSTLILPTSTDAGNTREQLTNGNSCISRFRIETYREGGKRGKLPQVLTGDSRPCN